MKVFFEFFGMAIFSLFAGFVFVRSVKWAIELLPKFTAYFN